MQIMWSGTCADCSPDPFRLQSTTPKKRRMLPAEKASGAAFAGGPVALAYAPCERPTRQDAPTASLAAIEPDREGSGYAIPGAYVMTSSRKRCSSSRAGCLVTSMVVAH